MPSVLISHHPDSVMVPRDFIPSLASLMPAAVSNAMSTFSTGKKYEQEEVRVDTKPFSPYAQNQPLVSVHVLIKSKAERDEKWLEKVHDGVMTDIGYLVESMRLETGVEFVREIELTVDLVTRRWANVGQLLEPR